VDEIRSWVAKAIRTVRGERGLTLDELAALAGTSRGYLWEVETARKTPSLEVLQAVAAALNVRLVDLLEGTPAPRKSKNPGLQTPEWLGREIVALARPAPPAEIERFRGLAAEFFAPYRRRLRSKKPK
jgi:transcriptional regulator with XRE-family HTH domain